MVRRYREVGARAKKAAKWGRWAGAAWDKIPLSRAHFSTQRTFRRHIGTRSHRKPPMGTAPIRTARSQRRFGLCQGY
jgi:hypothetical protein